MFLNSAWATPFFKIAVSLWSERMSEDPEA